MKPMQEYDLYLEQWPRAWLVETVTAIPKCQRPSTYGELRNISCTNLFSKVLEHFVLERLKREISPRSNQFGGLAGTSVNHYLVSAWDTVLEALEHDEMAAINLISIDFAKAFNTMSHGACIEAFINKGASDHSVSMIAAFLRGRRMRIKVGTSYSSERVVKGGSPQGTLLGNLLFVITTDMLEHPREQENNIFVAEECSDNSSDSFHTAEESELEVSDILSNHEDESFIHLQRCSGTPCDLRSSDSDNSVCDPMLVSVLRTDERPSNWKDQSIKVLKYVDDFLGIEKICVGEGIKSITQHKTQINVRANKSETFYKTVEQNAMNIGMSVNAKKTQMLCILPTLHSTVNSYIKINNELIHDQTELKILGFIFGREPTVGAQIQSISLKFRRRVWVLRHLKKASISQADLIKLYKSLVLPVLDYTSVVYHSMLNQKQELELENLQKLALKVIYGVTGVSYVSLLERSSLPSLKDRRITMLDKFITKLAGNNKYQSWFPLRSITHHDLRSERVYEEKFARTSRLYKSPLYFYRRRLNCI